MNNIYLQIPLRKPDISKVVLATVTRTTGSTPQKPGSSALFSQFELVTGTVGGGILEGKVQQIARESVVTKESGHYLFKLDNSVPGGEDALCGGKINVLIDSRLDKHIPAFEALQKSAASRIPGILITLVTNIGDEKAVVSRYWSAGDSDLMIPPEFRSRIKPVIDEMISNSLAGDFREIELEPPGEKSSSTLFLESVIPPARLIIAGAGHIGKALARIAIMLDFEITVIDDRPEFANSENIPFADHIITGDIGNNISDIEKGSDTFIVIVTRGHKDDGNALRACIKSDTAYVGMIGSKNKVALMKKEFIKNGWASREEWDKVYTPVGLEINSKTVGEIAVSIAAQLVKVKNERLNGVTAQRNNGAKHGVKSKIPPLKGIKGM
jgi:xanthine dehydrogenase accessory factor